MAWQTACQSLSKSGGPHLPSTTGAINEGARHFRLSRSKRQFIHPSRKIAFGNIALLNLGLTTLIASEFSSRSPIFTASWLSTSTYHLESAFLLQTLEDRVHWVVPALLQVVPQVWSTHEIPARTLRWGVSPQQFRLTGIRTVL